MAAGRTTLLVLTGLASVGIALVFVFALLPQFLAAEVASSQEYREQMLIESTKDLPEAGEFLSYYPGARAEVGTKDGLETVKYSYERQYPDRGFIQTVRLYITKLEESHDDEAGSFSYEVYMDCATTSFDFERNMEGSGMTSYAGYGNVTKFVIDSGCAK